MSRRFTGRHMLALMIAFFGTVIAVNFTMASFAVGTFGGTVVDNSYVASQRFNGWLEEARSQEALGWRARLALAPDRRVTVAIVDGGKALAQASLRAVARHPVGRSEDLPLSFVGDEEGAFRSALPLPRGRWLIHLEIESGGRRMRMIESLS